VSRAVAEETLPRYPGKELEAMSFAENYHRWIIDELQPFFGDSVAEVGAGIGRVSRMLLGRNIKRLHAFEPSRNMYPFLERELAAEGRATAVNDFFGAAQSGKAFDSVAYINVLEHIEDDRAEISHAYAALRPGGHLLIFVPALAWLYSDFDKQVGHFRRYERRALEALVKEAGFSIVRSSYFDAAGVVPWYVAFVLMGKTLSGGSVSLYDKLAVPVTRFFEGIVSPPLGKNILLVARKD
jgi:SAM-dependent methyltransferase